MKLHHILRGMEKLAQGLLGIVVLMIGAALVTWCVQGVRGNGFARWLASLPWLYWLTGWRW